MKNKTVFFLRIFLSLGLLQVLFYGTLNAASLREPICAVLITGIDCPSCAKVEPVILLKLTSQMPELVVLVYEIYKSHKSNRPVTDRYASSYLSPREPHAIPFLILGKKQYFRGEMEAIRGIQAIQNLSENMCPLPDGNSVPWMLLNLDDLPGSVKIFTKNRVFIRLPDSHDMALIESSSATSINSLIQAEHLWPALENMDFKETPPEPVYVSGGKILFQKAVKIGRWKLQWNE